MQNTENKRKIEAEGKNEGILKKLSGLLEKKDEHEVRERLRGTVRFFLLLSLSYLLAGIGLPLGLFPFVIVLACSHKSSLLPALLGGWIYAVSGKVPAVYFLAGAVVLVARIIAVLASRLLFDEDEGTEVVRYGEVAPKKDNKRVSVFCDSLLTRLTAGAVGGLVVGVYFLVISNFSFYSTAQTVLLSIGVPLITFVLSGVLGADVEIRRFGKWENFDKTHKALSFGAIFFLCVLSGQGKSLLGMPMAPFLAVLITLFICSEKGIFYGGLAAIVCGAALEIIYLPLLFLMAILFCLVSQVKRNMGLPAACALIVVWCYYIGGERGLLSYLPPMLLAIPFYYIADKYREMMSAPHLYDALSLSGIYFAEAVTEKTKNEVAYDRIDALSGAFSSLSETFYKLSDRFRRTDLLGIKRIAEASFEKHCEGCRNREICFGAEY